MSSGPIKAIDHERLEERDDSRLATAWLARPEDAGALTVPVQTLTLEDGQARRSTSSEGAILLMACTQESAAIARAVQAGRSGARVYLLTDAQAAPLESDLAHVPNLLVRRVAEVPAEALHAGTDCAIWFGDDAHRWRLDLDAAQSIALRQLFVRLFWHDAVDEAWSADGRFEFREVGERPFDVPRPLRTASIALLKGDDQIQTRSTDTHLLTNSTPQDVATVRRLWCRPSGAGHPRLRRSTEAGCQITWTDTGLPDMAVGPEAGRILLPGSAHRLRIDLSLGQASAALTVLGGAAEWSFHTGLRIGEFAPESARFWLADAAKSAPLTASQTIDLSVIRTVGLAEARTARPKTWPAPSVLTLQARYRWRVMPPTVPGSAQPDALVNQWRNFDQDWQKQVRAIEEALQSADGLGARIKSAFERLRGAVLGFKRKQDALVAELAPLRAAQPSLVGPTESARLSDRLAAVQAKVDQLIGNLKQAETRAIEDRERARQTAAWKAGVDKAVAELPTLRRRLGESQAKAAELAAKLAKIETDRSDVNALADKHAKKTALKDLKARQLKTRDEHRRAQQEAARVGGQIKALEHTRDAAFVFKPRTEPGRKAKSGQGFVPQASKSNRKPIPHDALPSVGVLRKHKGKRYLVIEDWVDLTEGQAEAERLGARLVAKEAS